MKVTNYQSKFEERIAQELTDHGVTFDYELYSYEYDVPVTNKRIMCSDCHSRDIVCTRWYTPDFFLQNSSPSIIIETKGRFTAKDRLKMLKVREQHKELADIKLLFMRDNFIHKRSKTRYSDWCKANNYDYDLYNVPKRWLK